MNILTKRYHGLGRKPLFFWARLLLGVIFLIASIDKIQHPKAFAQIIYNYQILPDFWVNLAAVIIPWIELLIGILLIIGIWSPGAVLIANALLLTFFCLLILNMARGIDVACGCFSTRPIEDPVFLWYVVRDVLLLSLGIYLLFKTIIQSPPFPEETTPDRQT